MSNQIAIPCLLMRGGTSKGPFFNQKDLPKHQQDRDQILLAALGSPDPRQIDGLGGAHALTSKVGIVAKSERDGVDLSFLFAQLQPSSDLVDTTPNCGNMLAAVVPFALETGMITAQGETTRMRVLTENTGMLSDITVSTPNGQLTYSGDTTIDGVPGHGAAIEIAFLDTEGSVCGSLFPTGAHLDPITIEGVGTINVTCIDNGMPMVLMTAASLGVTGYENVAELNNNTALKQVIEHIRLVTAKKMGLGDVRAKNYPKMCLIAAPRNGGTLHTRCFIPHVCHESIGVLAAVTVATACIFAHTIAHAYAQYITANDKQTLSIEHPAGEFSVALNIDHSVAPPKVIGAALVRTARLLMRGEVMINPTGITTTQSNQKELL